MQIIQIGHLLLLILVRPRGAGAISRDFTKKLTPQGGASTGALKFEKLKAPLFPGPRGAVDTNDWCITQIEEENHTCNKGN